MSQTASIPNLSRSDCSPRPKLHLETLSQPLPLNKVRQALNGLRDQYGYIPRDKLDELLTRQTVKHITMQITNPGSGDQPRHLPANSFLFEDDYTRIHERFRVILAVLIELSWEEHFFKFLNYDNDDSKLPFSQGELEHIDCDSALCPFFLKRQYEFIPQTIGGEGRHSWTSEFVLPFVSKVEIGGGGFSRVYKAELYPLYDKIEWTYLDEGRDVRQHLFLFFPYSYTDHDLRCNCSTSMPSNSCKIIRMKMLSC